MSAQLPGAEFLVRTARIDWLCRKCGETIPRGSKHLEYLGESPAYHGGYRYCPLCAESVWNIDPAHFS